ncbi:MAG: transposase [Sphaerochaeta sp.]|nr:transposase [Sphaerochaeta sp.]
MIKQYTKDFKTKHGKEALRLSELQEISVVGYARKHGIPHTTLHQWVTQCRKGAFTIEKEQSFVALKPSRPIIKQEEHIVIELIRCAEAFHS